MAPIVQFLIGWVYGHLFEYFAHKHILHNNKLFKRIFKRHFGVHHRIARKNNMYDENYLRVLNKNNMFEPLSLLFLSVLHLPIAFIYPYFYAALLYSMTVYFIAHRKSHIDVEWGKKWMPWHYNHHMGKNQHRSWGVRLPIVDYFLEK